MTVIQKKVLENIIKMMEDIDTYSIYSGLSEIIDSENIEADVNHKILNKFQELYTNAIKKKLNEIEEWTRAILADFATNK